MDDNAAGILRRIRAQEKGVKEAKKRGCNLKELARICLSSEEGKKSAGILKSEFEVLRRLNSESYREYLELVSDDYKQWLLALGINLDEKPLEV